MRKQQQRGLDSARKLLEAATFLFVEKGFDETTIDEIVLRAGSAKGTFYHHYESKAALLVALREKVIDHFQEHIDQALSNCPDDALELKLETWVSAACDAYARIGTLHDIVFGNCGSRWTVSDEIFMKGLAALLEEGHRKKIWTAEVPDVTATYIFRGMLGIIDDLIVTSKTVTTVGEEMSVLARRTVGL